MHTVVHNLHLSIGFYAHHLFCLDFRVDTLLCDALHLISQKMTLSLDIGRGETILHTAIEGHVAGDALLVCLHTHHDNLVCL